MLYHYMFYHIINLIYYFLFIFTVILNNCGQRIFFIYNMALEQLGLKNLPLCYTQGKLAKAQQTLRPITHCPFISHNWWSVSSPFLAADESLTIEVILPSLNINPTWFIEFFCNVIVRSKGLKSMIVFFSMFLLRLL